MKKVLIILLFLIVVGAGVTGTVYFYKQNENQINVNEQLAMQNAQVQSQLNAIGQMVEVYQVSKNVFSGNKILDCDLVAVSIPASTLSTSSVTDKSLLVGKYYKISLTPGTIMSVDMLMDESEEASVKLAYELTLESLPVGIMVGDYIDLRLLIASGEEFTVVTHKRIERIENDITITINVSEEEQAAILSMFNDLGVYSTGCIAYVSKYVTPGNSNSVANYPVQHEMENFIRFNPNIEDPTRLVNETLRDHVDEVLLKYTNSINTDSSSHYIDIMRKQLEGQLEAYQVWIEEHTDEEGNFTGDSISTDNSTSADGDGSFDNQVNESMDNLQQDLEDIQ